MTELSLAGCNIAPTDLNFLKPFINLTNLRLGETTNEEEDWDYWLHKLFRRSKFYGSLEPSKDLKRLRRLDIRRTDIDSGLEYLPDDLNLNNLIVDNVHHFLTIEELIEPIKPCDRLFFFRQEKEPDYPEVIYSHKIRDCKEFWEQKWKQSENKEKRKKIIFLSVLILIAVLLSYGFYKLFNTFFGRKDKTKKKN